MTLKNWFRHRGISTRSVIRLKYYGKILLNGEAVTVRETVSANDRVELYFADDEKAAEAENISVPIVYEDEHIIIMDKPPNMPVHPSKKLQSGTLANAFAYYVQNKMGWPLAFRAVNRLDRGTSGLVIAALNPVCAAGLVGNVNKQYVCICLGEIDADGTVDAPIGLCEDSKMKRCVSPEGKRAVTHYRRLFTNGKISVALVTLETGRTHQIRVHFAHIGHPLVGDTLYGTADSMIDRQALHCISVSFNHPISGCPVDVKTELCEDMKAVLEHYDAEKAIGEII